MPKENHYAVVVGVDQYPSYLNGKKNLNCPTERCESRPELVAAR